MNVSDKELLVEELEKQVLVCYDANERIFKNPWEKISWTYIFQTYRDIPFYREKYDDFSSDLKIIVKLK